MEEAQRRRSHRGIDAVRHSLRLGEEERTLLQGIGPQLMPHVPGWVDSFYTRLLLDPVAMRILDDDARVIRLKRSLHSWVHELLTLPWDESYERARERIGEAHVAVNMPTYLMVTAMSGLRGDAARTVGEIWSGEPEHGKRLADVLSRALDMELTLMLMAFRRRQRAMARQEDRMVYAQRAALRFADTLNDRVDTALCYADLAATDEDSRVEWLARLRDVLRGLSHVDRRLREQGKVNSMPAARVAVAEICRAALADVSTDGTTRLEYEVTPPNLEVSLVAPAVRLAIEELVQNGAIHAPGGTIRVLCTGTRAGGVQIEITDEGAGWSPDIREFRDIYRAGSGLGLSFCELVADLHRGRIELFTAPSGGAGVRFELGAVAAGDETSA